MTLRCLLSCHGLLPSGLRLECSAEEREGSVSPDAPQPGLDVEQCGGEPALLLGAIGPLIDLAQPLAPLGHERFQGIGGLQTGAERPKDAQ